jgi:hypothetical protein
MKRSGRVRAWVCLVVVVALVWAPRLATVAIAAEFVFPDLKQDGSAALLVLESADGSKSSSSRI